MARWLLAQSGMRLTTVITLIALAVLPAQAAYYVELTTGEKLTVQGYWRDGEDVHLMRGGVDVIVKHSRIKSIEEGAPEPEMRPESATATGSASAGSPSTATEPAADMGSEADAEAAAEEAEPRERLSAYKSRVGEMTVEQLQAEEERASNEMLAAQAARFQAKYGRKESPEVVKELTEQFRDLQARERAVDARLREINPQR